MKLHIRGGFSCREGSPKGLKSAIGHLNFGFRVFFLGDGREDRSAALLDFYDAQARVLVYKVMI